jgi:DNA recombination protein RmuC
MDYLMIALGLLNLVLLILALGMLKRREEGGEAAALAERLDRMTAGFGKSVADSGLDLQGRLGKDVGDLKGSISRDLAEGRRETAEVLGRVTQTLEQRFEKLLAANEQRMKELQDENRRQLDQMRATVDEKLQKTLETRLGESFKLVSERLEAVHKGLGEMNELAGGVGDLKKIFTNVKTRGTWGEIQLGNLLDQVLTPEQYARNVATRPDSRDVVEYAIKLPGRDGPEGRTVWLPIDAKFPVEDYQRLLEAQERADPAAVEAAGKALELRVKGCAKDIHDKYLNPPETTDFAIMYLPAEGLFAEVLRRPELSEKVQREYRVTVAGPTTLAALLNSLQMGFRTLAIERRSSEVWKVLGAAKTEFERFGEILDRVHKQLETATRTIDSVSVRTRAIKRCLLEVQQLPSEEAPELLALDEPGEQDEAAP